MKCPIAASGWPGALVAAPKRVVEAHAGPDFSLSAVGSALVRVEIGERMRRDVTGLLDIPLDASNLVVGIITIGLAVDDTIHFLFRFRRDQAIGGSIRDAARSTMTTTGSALFFTSLVLATGFSTMGILGTMQNTVDFGSLSALKIAVVFIADALLTPALIALATRER